MENRLVNVRNQGVGKQTVYLEGMTWKEMGDEERRMEATREGK